MLINTDLLSLSHFVLAGDCESVNVVNSSDISDYSWVLYIMPSKYDSDIGYNSSSSLNSGLLTYLIGNYSTSYDFLGKSNKGCLFSMISCMGNYDGIYNYVENIVEGNTSEFIELDKTHKHILTPFLGVGTKLPVELGLKTIYDIISVCRAPSSIHGVLVGDHSAAKTLLGDGLTSFRQVLFAYLGIQPSEVSVPADISIPLIYSEYDSTPSILDIDKSQALEEAGSKAYYMLFSIVRLCNLLYSLLEIDHSYRGIPVLGAHCPEYPKDWYVHSSSSRTITPYRYPALVSLLAAASRRVKDLEDPEHIDLDKLTSEWGPASLLSHIVTLREGCSKDIPLYKFMPKLCRSFFVQLYRITCKGVITLPSNKDYPRRTEASKQFVNTFKQYQDNNTLSDYLELSDLVLQSSLLQTSTKLRRIVRFTSTSAYEVILDPSTIPPVPVKGEITTDDTSVLRSWCNFSTRKKQYSKLKVITLENEVKCLASILDKSAECLLQKVDNLVNSDALYTLIDARSVEDMSDFYGFFSSRLTNSMVEESLIPRIKFTQYPLTQINLMDMLGYYASFGNTGIQKIILTVIKLLKVNNLELLVSNKPAYTDKRSFAKLSANLAVKEYLENLLNSSRV